MPRTYRLQLTKSERQSLLETATTGRHAAREIIRAQVLLKSADGWTEEQLAATLSISERTVRRIRRRASQSGAVSATREKPRCGPARKLTSEEEARLVALACSTPPPGRCRWTIRLLTTEAMKRELIRPVAAETVRQVLQKTKSSRGRLKAGAKRR